MFIFISYSYQIFISKLSSLENGLDGKRKNILYLLHIYKCFSNVWESPNKRRRSWYIGRVDYRCDPVNDFFFNGFFKPSYEIQFHRFFGPY